jgi:CRP-like cAMP-binding protein/Fe-S-cluster-containing hydrogenase component 2
VPGLYLIGAIAGQDLIKPALNQGYEVIEYILGHAVEPIDEALLQHTLERLSGASAQDKLATLAARVPLLADLAAPQLRELALVSTVHSVERGQVVFKEHDFSTTVFTIVEGSIHITTEEHPDSTVVRSQGEFFGEMSLLADRPRSATATAAERSLLFEIPRRSLLKLMRAESSVNRRINAAYVVRALQTYLGPTLATDAFRDLAAKAELVTFAKDAIVFREGDPGDALYVIRSGAMKISKTNRAGSEYVIAYRSPGQYVGEMALLSEHNQRQATVSAAMKTEAIRLWRDDFLAFVVAYPDVQQLMQREMDRRQVEAAVMLEAPNTTAVLTDFITHGVVESTDVLLIDETTCIRCDNCVTACAATHGGQTRLDRQHGPSFASVHVPVSCRHCEGAPCLQDCPPGDAIVRDAHGVVRIYEDKCIGCGNCANACPYGVIFMVEAPHQTPWWERFNLWHLVSKPTPAAETHRGIAVKCDLCAGLKGGPACVRSCPTGAAIRVTPEYFKHVDFR